MSYQGREDSQSCLNGSILLHETDLFGQGSDSEHFQCFLFFRVYHLVLEKHRESSERSSGLRQAEEHYLKVNQHKSN